jgi:hypothetical protein
MAKLKLSQHIALGVFLSEYNENSSLDEILQQLVDPPKDEESSVCVAEAYENIDPIYLADEIVSLAVSVQKAIDTELKR